MRIQSLLNPFTCDDQNHRSSESPPPPSATRTVSLNTSFPRRQKIPKDAMILTEGTKVVGFVNYPPYETGNDKHLATQHRKFQIHPMGKIAEYRRHIPYTSEKKEFTAKTGRDAFNGMSSSTGQEYANKWVVFQYTFKLPGDEREYVVIWDYNVGLTRVTPFFKSLKYSKTQPAKVLNLNPGLKDISHSITGGALTAQGYWMPYKAAKAVAATFCYEIRYALTPIFGTEFPSICIPPSDPNFAKFIIDPATVRECITECNRWRAEGEAYRITNTLQPPTTPKTPKTQFASPKWATKDKKQRRTRPSDLESGYGTDTDQSDKYFFSPEVSPRSKGWTAVNNRSRSPTEPPRSNPVTPWLSSVSGAVDCTPLRTKRTHSKAAYGPDEAVSLRLATPSSMPRSSTESSDLEDDDDTKERFTTEDITAANWLLKLKTADAELRPIEIASHPAKRTRRGSKY
ncbi:hypothetical protein CC78DRAFT_328147 [Lojkania enalia]|uniref:HTH APSES-type domain-containing protein n=1 Tax=Lojkania enalia TaxID=147567 RepID=A0A9P4K9J9_9PLEO|nr:hypothetical protein CC78DRAFT_328147 [Didymosphaeria enalia]